MCDIYTWESSCERGNVIIVFYYSTVLTNAQEITFWSWVYLLVAGGCSWTTESVFSVSEVSCVPLNRGSVSSIGLSLSNKGTHWKCHSGLTQASVWHQFWLPTKWLNDSAGHVFKIREPFKLFVRCCKGNDRLCGLVVRVLGYRSGGPGSIPGTTRFSGKKGKKSSGSGTGSTQPREYYWGATW
jgi:hypothetical protein